MPVALLIAGLIGPLLTEIYGWRHALVVIGIGCLLFPLILEFMRREFDSDKDMTRQFHLSDFRETIGLVIGKPELRGLPFGSFGFASMMGLVQVLGTVGQQCIPPVAPFPMSLATTLLIFSCCYICNLVSKGSQSSGQCAVLIVSSRSIK